MPAQLVPQLNGFAHFEAQVFLPTQAAYVNIDPLLVFQTAGLTENALNGTARYTIRYSTGSLDFVDKILSMAKADGNPLIRFRMGYGSMEKMLWHPWQSGLIIKHDSIPINVGDNAGHLVEVEVADAIFIMGRSNKTVARNGTLSSIVQQIAQENSLPAVIEPTQGQFNFVQNFMDDTRFVQTRLVPRAVSTSGHGNYLFYTQDGVLHFHSPDYQSTYLEMSYYESPYMSMGEGDTAQMLIDQGVSGIRLIAQDPYTGQGNTVDSDPAKALRLAKGIYRLDKIPSSQLNLPYHLGSNGPKDAEAIAQNFYERTRFINQKITLKLQKTIGIRAGNFLNLVISPSSQKVSTWSGVWFVAETSYAIKEGALALTLSLVRGEVTQNLSNIVAQLPNLQLVPEQDAPGRDLSLRSVQSSDLTVGSGNETSSTKPVLDATTLPV